MNDEAGTRPVDLRADAAVAEAAPAPLLIFAFVFFFNYIIIKKIKYQRK